MEQELPYVTVESTRVVARPWSNVTLICRGGGNPRPNLTWMFNNLPVMATVTEWNFTNTELTLWNLRESVVVECVAENSIGASSVVVEVVITGEWWSI